MTIHIETEARCLQSMTVPELRRRYAEVYGEETRVGSKPFLIKKILWRLQCLELGDISERARQRAREIANDADLRLRVPQGFQQQDPAKVRRMEEHPIKFKHDPRTPIVGHILTRIYKNQRVEVTVEIDGFTYNGRKYASLSAIASEVTGCHQNGFRFFRLTGGAA